MKNWFLPFTTPSSSPSIESSLQPAAVENRTKVKKRKRTKKFRDKSRRGWIWVRQKKSNLEMKGRRVESKVFQFRLSSEKIADDDDNEDEVETWDEKFAENFPPFFIVQQSSQPQFYVSKSFLIVQVAYRAQSQSMPLYELFHPINTALRRRCCARSIQFYGCNCLHSSQVYVSQKLWLDSSLWMCVMRSKKMSQQKQISEKATT